MIAASTRQLAIISEPNERAGARFGLPARSRCRTVSVVRRPGPTSNDLPARSRPSQRLARE